MSILYSEKVTRYASQVLRKSCAPSVTTASPREEKRRYKEKRACIERTRHSPVEVSTIIEVAARVLSRMYSLGCSWNYIPSADDFCDADTMTADGELDGAPCELRGVLRVFRRGTKKIKRTNDVDGVRGLRYHNESAAGITPRTSGARVAATALGLSKLDVVPEALLLTYAGDYRQWPIVRDAARSLRGGNCWAASIDDAGHRIVFARAVMPAATRALQLRERKSTVLSMRREAERLLMRWLEAASRKFLCAFDGFAGTAIPAKST